MNHSALDETVTFIRRIAQHAPSNYREMQEGIADALEATGAITPRQANAVVTGAKRQRVDIPARVMDCLRSNVSDPDDAPFTPPDDRHEFQRDLQEVMTAQQEVTRLIERLTTKWN